MTSLLIPLSLTGRVKSCFILYAKLVVMQLHIAISGTCVLFEIQLWVYKQAYVTECAQAVQVHSEVGLLRCTHIIPKIFQNWNRAKTKRGRYVGSG